MVMILKIMRDGYACEEINTLFENLIETESVVWSLLNMTDKSKENEW